jgi:hypothetical protein
MGSDIKRSTAAQCFPKSPEVSSGCWGICKFHSTGVIRSFAVGSGRAASSILAGGFGDNQMFLFLFGWQYEFGPLSATSGADIKDDSSSPVDGRKSDTVEDDHQEDCSLSSFF